MPGGNYPKSFLRPQVYRLMKNEAAAQAAFEEARVLIERGIAENQLVVGRHALLGQILAGLGQGEDAIREGRRAVELLPEDKDAFDGPLITLMLAQIYAMLGDAESSSPLLERSLTTPRGITVSILKLDPIWDPLRGDQRFQKMVAEGVTK